jgi:uncharacterized protein (TIGR03067 family)
MRPIRLILAYTVLIAISTDLGADDNDDKAAEIKKLQGTWTVASGEFMGKAMTPRELGIDTIVVEKSRMTLKNGDKEVAVYPFELFPDRKPREMIWTKKGPKGGKLSVIYEIDGAKLRICFPLVPGKPGGKPAEPPKKFETKDKPLGLLVAEKK